MNQYNFKIKIIDDFLNDDHFNELMSIKLKKEVDKNKMQVYHNSIDKNFNTTSSTINSDLLVSLQKKYHSKAIEVLKELSPEKVKLYDYSEFVLIETGSNYKFPIHDDTSNKLLSGVIYIKPEINSGTLFYANKKGDKKKQIDWKINKAVFFSRKEQTTWHSFEGDGKSNRIALVYNLMTNRIKEVYKAENKNYLLGQFRFYINPYLYKYFKFVI
tara:strand:- start:38 stop:682 length:645 start_codon:yes stop_codon:yes gene_type:complete